MENFNPKNLNDVDLEKIMSYLIERLYQEKSRVLIEKGIIVNISSFEITSNGIIALTINYVNDKNCLKTYVYYAGAGHKKEEVFELWNRLSKQQKVLLQKIPIYVTKNLG